MPLPLMSHGVWQLYSSLSPCFTVVQTRPHAYDSQRFKDGLQHILNSGTSKKIIRQHFFFYLYILPEIYVDKPATGLTVASRWIYSTV